MKQERLYSSEADLCRDFIAWARDLGWAAYPETDGWDVLLVDPDGRQLGVQAKLVFNATLIRQAIPGEYHCDEGPDFRAVLLPKMSSDARRVLDYCGLNHFTTPPYWSSRDGFVPAISDAILRDWMPVKRCKLPGYVPDVVAGASSPVMLTEWKVKALRVCAVLERDGEITAKQIRAQGIDPRRWIHLSGWLKPKHLCRGVYVRGPKLNFDRQHPTVYAEIKAQMEAEVPA